MHKMVSRSYDLCPGEEKKGEKSNFDKGFSLLFFERGNKSKRNFLDFKHLDTFFKNIKDILSFHFILDLSVFDPQ